MDKTSSLRFCQKTHIIAGPFFWDNVPFAVEALISELSGGENQAAQKEKIFLNGL